MCFSRYIHARRCLLGTALLVSLSGQATAADLSGYLSVTTDYVWRGVTQSDGDPAAQLGADLSLDGGFYFGIWGSTVDIANGPTRQRDTQVNYYAGYIADLGSRWSLGANVVAYTYPGTQGDVDYNYREYVLSANYDDRLWIEYAYSDDLYDSGQESHNYDIYFEYPIAEAWMIGGGGGYFDVSALAGSGFANWQVGVTRSAGRIDVDLRYHDANRWVPIVSSEDRADARVALTIRFSF